MVNKENVGIMEDEEAEGEKLQWEIKDIQQIFKG